MKNKGFTLIELLGVIVLITIISLIVLPMISNAIKEGQEQSDKQTKSSIEMSAENWALDNKGKLPENNCYITVQTLIDKNYLENDNEEYNKYVIITKTGEKGSTYKTGVYKYEYSENKVENECK